MHISSLLVPDRVLLGISAANKQALLQDLSHRLAPAAGVSASVIASALSAREMFGSTGLGRGFALPHARVQGVERLWGLFARLVSPIPFDAIDGIPVDQVFLLLAPAGVGHDHLAALAAISRRLRDDGVLDNLRAATTSAEAYALLTGNGRAG